MGTLMPHRACHQACLARARTSHVSASLVVGTSDVVGMWMLAATNALCFTSPMGARTPLLALSANGAIKSSRASVAIARQDAAITFNELRKLDDRVRLLETTGIAALSSFYEADKDCFSLTPGRNRVSITSTC